jgi:hypothetical protein
MNIFDNPLVYGFVFALGFVLCVAGITSGTDGAVVIGLIVMAASFRQWQGWKDQQSGS